jgi:hypothetical protein
MSVYKYVYYYVYMSVYKYMSAGITHQTVWDISPSTRITAEEIKNYF